jgi:hypothetical protein
MQDERYIADPATGCWIWQGARNSRGYGNMWDKGRKAARCAHRIYYEQHVGPIPDGLVLDHLCRNNACVNPEHLQPVTQAENVRRGVKAKLTMEIVVEIRRSTASAADLATRFGVHVNTIREAKRGDRWGLGGVT